MISMGKLILLALIVLAAVLVWKAFGPASWNQNRHANSVNRPAIKGPDDDEEFLWNIEKNRFKERRRQEQERQQRHDEQQRHEEQQREENQQHQGRDRGTSDRRSDVGDQTDPNTHGAQDSRNTNPQDGSLDRDQPTNSDTPRDDEKTDDQ